KLDVFVNQSSWLITVFLVIMLVFAIIAALTFSHRFTRPIVGLDRIARSVTKGLKNQDQLLDRKVFKRGDELGSLASHFKTLIIRLKNTIQLAQEKDEVLDAFAEKESIRSWHSEGLVTFNEVLRDHPDNLESLSFALVSELVKYTNSAQGGIFILHEEEGQEAMMELKGCYAYDRKKYLNKTLKIGEGLVGTVWREDKTMKITDIPQNYAYINTGLGKARPNCLLIVPIKSRDRIEGVIELISFKEYKDYEVNFLETLSQRIGSALTNIKANAKTKELLEVSEAFARQAKEKESALQKQLEAYKLDVADFRARLDAAFAEAQMYESVLGKVYAGLIVTDHEFKITKVNKIVTSLYGYQESELIGESIDVLIETN
ncbi:MAG: GAF domain-containing protein, partial [Bacteroidota bacterium]